jgi:hypothetical protein
VNENFNSSKEIIYLISFPSGESAHDFRKFINQKESKGVMISHHDTIHEKTWKVEYNISRIDELIATKAKELKKPLSNKE